MEESERSGGWRGGQDGGGREGGRICGGVQDVD